MAEEEGEAGGSVLKKYGPLAAIVLLAQIVLAWVVIKVALPGNMPQDEADEELETAYVQPTQQDEEDNSLPFQYAPDALLNITANPAGTNMSRFVVIDAALGLIGHDEEGEKLKPEKYLEIGSKIDLNMPKIKAVITSVIRAQTVDRLEGEAFDEVTVNIRKKLNEEVFHRAFNLQRDKMAVEVKEFIVLKIIVQ